MTKYSFTLSIGYPSAIVEDEFCLEDFGYDEKTWAALSDDERDKELDMQWTDWSSNYIDGEIFLVLDAY